jgi:metal-responsive CopG/Arc/MetJ family transcriptional regulator
MTTGLRKLTVSIPKSLVSFADEVAIEENISRSKVVSNCLSEFAQIRKAKLMEEGYKAMAQEHKLFAKISAEAASEVIPPWD